MLRERGEKKANVKSWKQSNSFNTTSGGSSWVVVYQLPLKKMRYIYQASLVVQLVKNLPAMQETLVRFLGSGRSAGEGIGYPLWFSVLPLWLSWWRICLQFGRPGFDLWLGRSPGEWKAYSLHRDEKKVNVKSWKQSSSLNIPSSGSSWVVMYQLPLKKIWYMYRWNITQPLKKWRSIICRDVDGQRVCHAERSKSEREKYHILMHVCGI